MNVFKYTIKETNWDGSVTVYEGESRYSQEQAKANAISAAVKNGWKNVSPLF